ncbi:MAG: magnesium transporter [Anaerolineae bacterium]|nr:magnesium transporter [Anaerolineae bacterium]
MAIYLSQILGRAVWDAQGRRVGRVSDVLVAETERGFPPLRAIALRPDDGQETLIPAGEIAWLSPSVILKSTEPARYTPRGDELWLKRQVLDRQIVDTEDRRLVRVNDLQFTRVGDNGRYYLSAVNVGTSSLLRRLGVEEPARRVLSALRRPLPEKVISWQDVASVQADAPIRLRVARDRLSQMDPVDIADIVIELDRPSGQALIETFDDETAADTISEVHPELQAAILTSLPPERAADLLEEMDPDDAADVLATLKEEDRESLLGLMEKEEADEVGMLLGYPEDSAGGIMTTEFATIPTGLTVGEALAHLRRSREAREDEAMYYVHVVDEAGRLRGVVSLRDLVLAEPDTPVSEVMVKRPVTVRPEESQEEVARLVAKYDLLSVPVVDEEGVLKGIVTVDDALDAVLPTAWKKRLPRFF